MSLKKCKDCSSEISEKAKACPSCGAPQGPKQYSLGKLVLLVVAGWAIYAFFSGEPSQPVATNPSGEALSPKHKEVENRFKSDEEPTSKEGKWTSNSIFKVTVINDGSSRDGYAQYVCSVLYDYGFKGKNVQVQVIDVLELSTTGKWKKLGVAFCE